MDYYQPLQNGAIYHVYNCGNNFEPLFTEDWHYKRFLKKCRKYIYPIADIYAYCLLQDHFHLALKFKEPTDLHRLNPKRFPEPLDNYPDSDTEVNFYDQVSNGLSRQFSDLFNSHSKTINMTSGRKGKLFCLPFKRILVDNNTYAMKLICYIHRNPIHHGYTDDLETWSYSSYSDHINGNKALTQTSVIRDWFGSEDDYLRIHEDYKEEYLDSKYFLE